MKRFAQFAVALSIISVAGCGPGSTGSKSDTPAPAPKPPAIFSEVTESAGIRYQWQIAGTRPLNILQTIGNGCAFLDYDNDGKLDILLVGPRPALYKGDGNGHFTDVTHSVGLDRLQGHFLGCTVGDYDNDGYDDIYLSAYKGGVLLHNSHGKAFSDVTAAMRLPPQNWGTSCAFVDVDGDGKLDLFIGNYAQFGPKSRQLCDYSGHLSACGPRFYDPWRGKLYRNTGSRFVDITDVWGVNKSTGKVLGVATADFDGSGHQSIALANDEVAGDLMQSSGRKFENNGAKSGTAYDGNGGVHGGMGTDWGDYDNDGKLDLAVATFQHEPKCIYHNDGGYFSENSASLGISEKTSPWVAFGVKWLDYDNDGYLDITFANGHVQDNIADVDKGSTYKQKPQLFRNVNGTSFQDVSDIAGPAFQQEIMGRGLAIGDFDNDGRMDLLFVNSEGKPMLLHNESHTSNHWLLCTLHGVMSNRDGLGALVTVEAGGHKALRQCQTNGSYLSASDRRVHFGLGAATRATITVRWPGGLTSKYSDVQADRIVTLTEGESKPR